MWSTETDARRIIEHKDDPEEESTQSDEENSEKIMEHFPISILETSMTHTADAPTVTGKAEGTHRQLQCQACGPSAGGLAEGDQWQQAHLTKTTSSATVIVEDELDEEGIQN